MARKKAKKAKTTRKPDITGKTVFIALTRSSWDKNPPWQLYGSDLHSSAKAALNCGCCDSNGAENAAVLEVTITALHRQTVAFEKADSVNMKID